ncbi:hypothetical protein niasHT_035054 [Heterodera trifolii]|uniref:Peptidase S1 domain-containing protein n=1 Tax=Heterodera trifolii TaxID=157864 RepID=A0ABD2INS0_9BILA
MCYNGTMEEKLFPWKLKKGFRFDKLFNVSSEPVIGEQFGPKQKINFDKEFFAHSNFGPFLADYTGLWLLAVDILPRFGQKPTNLKFVVPAECQLSLREKPWQQNCLTFDFEAAQKQAAIKHHTQRVINPLVYHGYEMDDLSLMPWMAHFHGEILKKNKRTNQLETKNTTCGCTKISPEFVLVAAHCVALVKEGANIYLVDPDCKNNSDEAAIDPDFLHSGTGNLIECDGLNKSGRICVGGVTVRPGDSGGPLLASNGTNYVQVGVTSWGFACGRRKEKSGEIGAFSVFSRLDGCWIEKITGIHCGI